MHSKAYSRGPLMVFESFWRSRHIIAAMTKREIIGRYRGSFFGILWSFFSPLLMLVVYTFVFSVVFKARWSEGTEDYGEFGIMLFAGLIVFTMFAECISRAPSLILSNANYVKKVVFPLESLPWSTLGATVFHGLMSVVVLLVMSVCFRANIHWTVLLFPLVVAPMLLVAMGVSWFLASLGVFVRDLGQIVGFFLTAMMFMSPIFYPVSALPEVLRRYILLSPVTFTIEQARSVLVRGAEPNWTGLFVNLVLSIVVAWLGLVWFERTRHGFADVI